MSNRTCHDNANSEPGVRLRLLVAAAAWICFANPGAASAQVTETVLHSFTNSGDGANPDAPVLVDMSAKSGAVRALYSTASEPAFRLTPPKEGQTTWKDDILWEFDTTKAFGTNVSGLTPSTARLTKQTSFYGTTSYGGDINASCNQVYDTTCGTMFSVTGHKATIIYNFTGGSDGGEPFFGVAGAERGTIYTTTELGGGSSGCGTVVELTPPAQGKTAWTETTIWTFSGNNDGCIPGQLIIDNAGALYSTTESGGRTNNGVVFKLRPPANGQTAWTEQTLWSFAGGTDGAAPFATVVAAKNGVLYGTTTGGGASNDGTVFQLTPPGKAKTAWGEKILWSFTGGADGAAPYAPLISDATEALYGTAGAGGASGAGTVFKLTPPAKGQTAWTQTTLWSFTGGSDGSNPYAALSSDKAGVLYSDTFAGGSEDLGVVFSLAGTGFVPQ